MGFMTSEAGNVWQGRREQTCLPRTVVGSQRVWIEDTTTRSRSLKLVISGPIDLDWKGIR